MARKPRHRFDIVSGLIDYSSMDTVISIDKGAGPLIVMIHGWGQTSYAFEPLADILKDRYRIIALDLPGHGLAKGADGPFTFARYVDEVKLAFSSLSIDRFHLLGWSMGGSLAARYALEGHAPSPASIILLSATPRFVDPAKGIGVGQHPASLKKMIRQVGADHDLGLRSYIESFFQSGEDIDPADTEIIRRRLIPAETFPPAKEALVEGLRELETENLLDHPGEYRGPVLIIHGSLDKICPAGGQRLWKERFENVTWAPVENGGHALNLTRSYDVASHIDHFLSDK